MTARYEVFCPPTHSENLRQVLNRARHRFYHDQPMVRETSHPTGIHETLIAFSQRWPELRLRLVVLPEGQDCNLFEVYWYRGGRYAEHTQPPIAPPVDPPADVQWQ